MNNPVELIDVAEYEMEIERLRAALSDARASMLGWQPDEATPMRHQMAMAIGRINNVLTPNFSTKEKQK